MYQCLEIDDKERSILKKFAADKQSLFLIVIAIVFSPVVIGIRYCLFKMGKLEDYMAGRISKAAFWELVKFKYPTHQIVFCTERALQTIKFEGSYSL